jgi:streptogramin lyase
LRSHWLLAAAVAVATPAAAWQGARLLHLEPGDQHGDVQTPILDWQPAAPQVDADGRVWIADRSGSVRVIVPWLGVRHQSRIEGGVEAGGVSTADGRGRLFVSRDGYLHRIIPESPTATTLGTGGLPTAVDFACREGRLHAWPDAHGGVTILDDDGNVVERLEGELYRTRPVRGGAAVGCAGGRMVAATAGGKLIGLLDGVPVWTAEPAETAGSDWAPRVAAVGDDWWLCSRTRGCLIVSATDGAVRAAVTSVGAWDGPVLLGNDRVGVTNIEGRLQILDSAGRQVTEVDVALGPQRLLEPREQTDSALLWTVGSDGALRRIDPSNGSVQVLYRAPSGFFAAGPIFHDGHVVLLTNFGSTLHFQLR